MCTGSNFCLSPLFVDPPLHNSRLKTIKVLKSIGGKTKRGRVSCSKNEGIYYYQHSHKNYSNWNNLETPRTKMAG